MTALLLAAGLLLGAAPAGPNPYLAQARVLYQGLEYEKALVKLKKAGESPNVLEEERAEIQIYFGLCHYQLGDEAAARVAFRAALVAAPKVRLPPLTSPKIATVFNDEVAAWEKAHPSKPEPASDVPRAAEGKPPEGPKTSQPGDAPAAATAPPEATTPPSAKTDAVPSAPGKLLWPSLVAAGVAAALVGTAAYLGQTASDRAGEARKATYASDAVSISKDAQERATLANVLYGTAGGIAALGVVFIVVF